MHYPDLKAVEKFLGDVKNGAIHLIWECYYHKMRDMLPPDVEASLPDVFDCPQLPEYYRARD